MERENIFEHDGFPTHEGYVNVYDDGYGLVRRKRIHAEMYSSNERSVLYRIHIIPKSCKKETCK